MKTEEIYFNATLRYSCIMKNDGFLIVKIQEGKIVDISGLFTNDLIASKKNGDAIVLTFYSMDSTLWTYSEEVSVEIGDDAKKTLPLKVEKMTDVYLDGIKKKTLFQIETNYKILDEKEKEIIMLRYYKQKTQMQVSKILGITQVQVSRIERKILDKMKKKLIG